MDESKEIKKRHELWINGILMHKESVLLMYEIVKKHKKITYRKFMDEFEKRYDDMGMASEEIAVIHLAYSGIIGVHETDGPDVYFFTAQHTPEEILAVFKKDLLLGTLYEMNRKIDERMEKRDRA